MTKFIIVRHAETEANVAQVWHGALDAPLTERGMLQVKRTAQRMAELVEEHAVDHFYVSPLPRARSTAAAIAAAIRLEPVIDDDLREFSIGDWEGRSFMELRAQEDLWNRWHADPSFAPPRGESPVTFGERVERTFTRLAQSHPDETLLVVSHGAVIANLLMRRLGDGAQDWRAWDPHNCAISVLVNDASGSWRGLLVNDITHLPPAAQVVKDQALFAAETKAQATAEPAAKGEA